MALEKQEMICVQIGEWKKRSERGEVCGMLCCEGKPVVSCSHCGNWYCDDHSFVLQLPTHPIQIEMISEK